MVDDGLLVVVVIADKHATGCHDAELPVYDASSEAEYVI